MSKTTKKQNLNIWVPKTLKTSLRKLANEQLGGNLSQLIVLICQDFLNNKRQITIGNNKKEKR